MGPLEHLLQARVRNGTTPQAQTATSVMKEQSDGPVKLSHGKRLLPERSGPLGVRRLYTITVQSNNIVTKSKDCWEQAAKQLKGT